MVFNNDVISVTTYYVDTFHSCVEGHTQSQFRHGMSRSWLNRF